MLCDVLIVLFPHLLCTYLHTLLSILHLYSVCVNLCRKHYNRMYSLQYELYIISYVTVQKLSPRVMYTDACM